MADVFLWDHVIHSPLSNAASLAAIDVTGYVNGVAANVIGVGFFTYNNASVATADNVTVIEPTAGPGRWLITPVNIGASNSILGTTGSAGVTSVIPFTSLARTLAAETTASDFRAEISAASSGANSDITSLSGLTTPLSVPQGGSGAVSLTGVLIGNGAAAFTTVTAPAGAIVGTSDSQVLTNKTIALASNTLTGVAASGANSDITSLSGLTTPLSASQGGTGVNSLGAGVATFLQTPSSANLASAVTDETGSGALVFATSPTLVTPLLGTPASGNLSNCTNYSANSLTGTTLASSVVTASLTNILPQVSIGQQGATTGAVSLVGTTSGSIKIQSQDAAGTYNFNIPTTAGTSNQFLRSKGGGSAAMDWSNAIVTVNYVVLTASSGTYTPSAGLICIDLIMIGGGGGGGGCAASSAGLGGGAGGGGGAGVCIGTLIAANVGGSVSYGVGSGGSGGSAGANNGTAGGNTTFGTFIANGGSFGIGAGANAASNGGAAGSGSVVGNMAVFPGSNGQSGSAVVTANAYVTLGGRGGNSTYGQGGIGTSDDGNGAAGSNYGAGGQGGGSKSGGAAASGGNGSSGIIFIREYLSQ